MSNLEVYFENHKNALKFPWSIYHKPLIRNLDQFLRLNLKEGMEILIIGPGDFQEFSLINSYKAKISLLDIDPRTLEKKKEELGSLIQHSYLVDDSFNGYPVHEKFDLIYAKEVIEHIPQYEVFISKINGLLKPNGKIWLSTPNYGFFLLPFLEATVLEIIARFSGFSRKNIHPSKFGRKLLEDKIKAGKFHNTSVIETPYKLALIVQASKAP